jgi:hypothetical protein
MPAAPAAFLRAPQYAQATLLTLLTGGNGSTTQCVHRVPLLLPQLLQAAVRRACLPLHGARPSCESRGTRALTRARTPAHTHAHAHRCRLANDSASWSAPLPSPSTAPPSTRCSRTGPPTKRCLSSRVRHGRCACALHALRSPKPAAVSSCSHMAELTHRRVAGAALCAAIA